MLFKSRDELSQSRLAFNLLLPLVTAICISLGVNVQAQEPSPAPAAPQKSAAPQADEWADDFS